MSEKPWYWPDTQGFLAVAIISLIAAIVLIMMFHPPQLTDSTQGVLMTMIGVLTATLKEVYSYYFSSSSSSRTKDETIKTLTTVVAPDKETANVAVH